MSSVAAHALLPRRVPGDTGTAQVVGRCYDTCAVQELLARSRGERVSKEQVQRLRQRGDILAMKTLDDTWVYPAWQFAASGSVRPEVVAVLNAVRAADRWEVATWFRSSSEPLADLSPLEWLDDDGPVAPVVDAGTRTLRRAS